MNASMSSRRVGFHEVKSEVSAVTSILACIIGGVFSFAAVKSGVAVLAIPGIVLVGGALMQWNISLWNTVIDWLRRK